MGSWARVIRRESRVKRVLERGGRGGLEERRRTGTKHVTDAAFRTLNPRT